MSLSRSAVPAAVIVALALALSCATARAAGSVQIVSSAGTKTVNLAQLKPDVHDDTYTNVATPGGAPGTVTVADGYSLPIILGALPGSISFQSVEIPAPEGPPVVLDDLQATSPNGYSTGGPPVVWEDGAGGHFLVPSSPGGDITGAGETFAAATIMITLHHGPALSVGISPFAAFVGKPIQFNSTVGGAPPAASLSFQWFLGDNTTSSQADPSHVYTRTGTYNVYLQVTGSSDDSVGASSVIQVVVGKPPPRLIAPGTGGAGTGSGTAGTAGTQGSGNGSGGGSAATTTTPAGAKPAPARRAPAKRRVRHRPPQAPRPTGPLVSGIAISYVTQPAGASGAAGGAAAAARQAHLRANARGLQEGMWIWFAVLLALFAGGLLELRGPWRARTAIAEAQ
jgi:hypothetical protein